MNHKQMFALLNDYLDGQLGPSEYNEVERHVKSCVSCFAELEGLRALRQSVGKLQREIAVPDYLWENVQSATTRPSPQILQLPETTRNSKTSFRGWSYRIATIAAVVVIAIVGFLVGSFPGGHSWSVATLEGAPCIGTEPIQAKGSLELGEWLETDKDSRARVSVGSIGELVVEPNTRLRLLQGEGSDHRIALARGMIDATIWAPPRIFFVETPSATAIDLGCAYTLRVTDNGSSILNVTHGFVALELAGRSSIIPAGAMCETRPGIGPGTPYFVDAETGFQRAVMEYDFGSDKNNALNVLLDLARPKDALTLFHLLSSRKTLQRARIFDRLSVLSPPPAGITKEGILLDDQEMFNRWAEDLGLENHRWL